MELQALQNTASSAGGKVSLAPQVYGYSGFPVPGECTRHAGKPHPRASEHSHCPVIMPIGGRATGNRDQVCCLMARQGPASTLLHLSMQHPSSPPSAYRLHTFVTVAWQISKAATISWSFHPSSTFNNTRARVKVRAMALPRWTNTYKC
jgi:hypothetical protein